VENETTTNKEVFELDPISHGKMEAKGQRENTERQL
jgi:hypothetical protein